MVTYLALEDLNFVWSVADVAKFDAMWKAGRSIGKIAETLKREQDEVAVLAMDRSRKSVIGPRVGGVFGGDPVKREVRMSLTMELYITAKRNGQHDAAIARDYGIQPQYLYQRKRKWGLMK